MSYINTFMWYIATVFLIGCGLYYTYKLHFVQFNFKKILNSLKKDQENDEGISPFKTLTLSLAARIGVGSLAGIALGIYKGGIGVIFWLLLSSLITLPNSFVESTLSVIFQHKRKKEVIGGPSFYIEKGLNNKKLAVIYSVIICLSYLGCFVAIQSNTIATSLYTYINIPKIVTGIIISIISYIIISKGIKRIANATSILVPIMGIIYLIVCLYIVIINIDMIPSIIISILKEAFNFNTMKWGIISSIIIGIQRGIFSTEAGTGTGAIASGSSSSISPTKQGYIAMLGVYFTSFIVCFGTALIIISSNINLNKFTDPNGIEITLEALNNHLGNFGTIILIFCIFSFAFSTIISGYYYGESSIKYIKDDINNFNIKLLNIIIMVILIYGAIMTPSKLWNIVDIGVAILAIINCYAMIKLRNKVIKEYQNDRK